MPRVDDPGCMMDRGGFYNSNFSTLFEEDLRYKDVPFFHMMNFDNILVGFSQV